MCKGKHTTLLLVLVLTSVALLTWSVTLLVPWPLLALLLVPLLGGVLLTLLTLLAAGGEGPAGWLGFFWTAG